MMTPKETEAARRRLGASSWVWEERMARFSENWRRLSLPQRTALVKSSNGYVETKHVDQVFDHYPARALLDDKSWRKIVTRLGMFFSEAKLTESRGIVKFDDASEKKLTNFIGALYHSAASILLDAHGNLKVDIIDAYDWQRNADFYKLSTIRKLLVSFVRAMVANCVRGDSEHDGSKALKMKFGYQYFDAFSRFFDSEEPLSTTRLTARRIFLDRELVKQNSLLKQLKECKESKKQEQLVKDFILMSIEDDYKKEVHGGADAHQVGSPLAEEHAMLKKVIANVRQAANWLESLGGDFSVVNKTDGAGVFLNLRLILQKHWVMANYYLHKSGVFLTEVAQLRDDKKPTKQKAAPGKTVCQGATHFDTSAVFFSGLTAEPDPKPLRDSSRAQAVPGKR